MKARTLSSCGKLAVASMLAYILFSGCAHETSESISGSGTTTQTGLVGALYDRVGNPAEGAVVRCVKTGQIDIAGMGKAGALIVDSTTVNSNGTYVFSRLPDGQYGIIGSKNDSACFQDSIVVKDGKGEARPDTLKQTGSIRGVVRLRAGDDPRTVIILVYGINQFGFPNDSSGHFTLDGIPAGSYRVHVLSQIAGYQPLDTLWTVAPGASVILADTVGLSYTGTGFNLSAITGLHATSLADKMQILLSWNRGDTSKAAGYNVYRGRPGRTFIDAPVNTRTIIDTFWVDDSLWPGDTVIYRVKPVTSNGEIGAFYSNADTIVVQSSYRLLYTLNAPSSFVMGASVLPTLAEGHFYLPDSKTASILEYDSLGAKIGTFGNNGPGKLVNPLGVKVWNSMFHVCDKDSFDSNSMTGVFSIKRFTMNGTFVDSITIRSYYVANYAILGDRDYLIQNIQTDDFIHSRNDTIINDFGSFSGMNRALIDKDLLADSMLITQTNRLAVLDRNVVQFVNYSNQVQSTFELPAYSWIMGTGPTTLLAQSGRKTTLDGQGFVLVNRAEIMVFDKTGRVIADLPSANPTDQVSSMTMDSAGRIYVTYQSATVFVYGK